MWTLYNSHKILCGYWSNAFLPVPSVGPTALGHPLELFGLGWEKLRTLKRNLYTIGGRNEYRMFSAFLYFLLQTHICFIMK